MFPAVNVQRAVRVVEPVRVLIWTFLLFGLGLVVAPVVPDINVTFGAVVFWVAVVVSSLAGVAAAAPHRLVVSGWTQVARSFPAAQLAARCIGLGLVGVILSVIDRYVVRGAPLSWDFFEARDVVADAGSGLISIVAAAASSFAAFGLIAAWLARALGQPISGSTEALAIVSLMTYVFLSISLGSRSLMLVCVLIHVLAAAFFRILRVGAVGWRTIVVVIGSLLAIVGASVWLLLERLDQMGLSPVASIELSGYAYTLKPSAKIVDLLDGGSSFGNVGAALYSLLLYVYHGLFEFWLLFDSYASPHLCGAQTFWLPLKLFTVISGSNVQIDADALIGNRSGVYTTFVGPMFLDFGWFAPAFAFLFFLLLGYPFRRVVAGDLRWLPAAIQVTVIIVLGPVVSLMDSSVGTFLLLASVALPWLAKSRS